MRVYTNNAQNDSYVKQEKISLSFFIFNLTNLYFELINALRSKSVFIWADVVDNLSSTLHDFLVAILSRKIKEDISDEYNYGVQRLEIFTSFVCDLLLMIGMLIVLIVSIANLFHPQHPTDNIILYILLKTCNAAFDGLYVYKQYKIYINNKSVLAKVSLNSFLYYLGSDLMYLIAGIICYFFRDTNFIVYLNPIFTILVVIYFAYKCIKRLTNYFLEISDHSIPLANQDELFDIVLENTSDINKIKYVNCRVLNSILHIDMNIEFKDDVTYKKQTELLKQIATKIKEKYPHSITNFIIGDE